MKLWHMYVLDVSCFVFCDGELFLILFLQSIITLLAYQIISPLAAL